MVVWCGFCAVGGVCVCVCGGGVVVWFLCVCLCGLLGFFLFVFCGGGRWCAMRKLFQNLSRIKCFLFSTENSMRIGGKYML